MADLTVGALVGAAVILIGNLLGALQKIHQLTKELRWKKAVTAQRMIDDTWANPLAHAALVMLDWNGRRYGIEGRKSQPITFEYRNRALRISDDKAFDDDEVFVRDAFDELFNQLSFTQNAISIGAVSGQDVIGWWRYYVVRLAENKSVMQSFLQQYDYPLALEFLMALEEWSPATSR